MKVLLSGIVGSTAYGLAGPGSDVDRVGTFAMPTMALVGLRTHRETHVTSNPDSTMHEARKFCLLALSCNPTAFELMWLPDDLYEVRTEFGNELIAIRRAFLSAPRVRDAYLGYAGQQLRRLSDRGDGSPGTRGRIAKHARHLMRLCHQGLHLYRTGDLVIRLDDPEAFRAFGESVAAGDVTAARELIADYERRFDAARSVLPDRAAEAVVERWLRGVRVAHWTPDADLPA